jgi:hypothetical protein
VQGEEAEEELEPVRFPSPRAVWASQPTAPTDAITRARSSERIVIVERMFEATGNVPVRGAVEMSAIRW